MKVANVMPGDRLQVSLRYSELLVPKSGVYELDYPTVVGPRYSNQPAASAKPQDKFIASPYTPAGNAPSYRFELSGSVSAAIPLQSLESPSHSIVSRIDHPGLRHFSVAPSERAGGNRDFILRYRLAGDAIQSGLSLFDAGGEKFFLLQVEPPKRVPNELIPAREFVFIVDVSGSMAGFPLETAKKLLRELIGGLRATDKFSVPLSDGSALAVEPGACSRQERGATAGLGLLHRRDAAGPAVGWRRSQPEYWAHAAPVSVVVGVSAALLFAARGRTWDDGRYAFRSSEQPERVTTEPGSRG